MADRILPETESHPQLHEIPNHPGYYASSDGEVWSALQSGGRAGSVRLRDVPVRTKMVYRECEHCREMFKTKYITARFCSKSCARYKHSGFGTLLYRVWCSMRMRCSPKSRQDKERRLYYDRGIRVCDEWRESFDAFRGWALSHGYEEGLHLDRRDGNGPYSPENCRWVTAAQNIRNQRPGARKRRGAHPSRFKGVYWNYSGWSASICFNYQYQYLGLYKTEEEAAMAYNKAAAELFGDYACLNEVSTE